MLRQNLTRRTHRPESRNWTQAFGILAVLILAAGLGSLLLRNRDQSGPAPTSAASPTPTALPAGAAIVIVSDDWGRVNTARVSVELFAARNSLGTYSLPGNSGKFVVPAELLTVPNITAAVIRADAPRHFAAHSDEMVVATGGTQRLARSLVEIRLDRYEPLLALLLVVPGAFGFILAVGYLTESSRGYASAGYPLLITIIWSAVVLTFTYLYTQDSGYHVPLFWPDAFASSGVVVFAFLGSLVYTAYVLQERSQALFTRMSPVRQRKFHFRVGSRILVAPYVALVAHSILTATFPALREGPFAVFLGFFGGLSIKPILEFLNKVGMRVLSSDSVDAVAARLLASERRAPAGPVADRALVQPNQNLLDAVAQARAQLAATPEVVAVEAGTKVTGLEATGREAIVVYVRQKRTDLPGNAAVPSQIAGLPTDVQEFPAPDPSKPCRPLAMTVMWSKVHDMHLQEQPQNANPQSPSIELVGGVLVAVSDAPFVLFRPDRTELDPVAAYKLVRPMLGDGFDFVAFIVDSRALGVNVSNYCVQVFNDVKGINHHKGDAFNERPAYGTNRLIAIQVFTALEINRPVTRRGALHELGHAWCAYPTFKKANSAVARNDLLLESEAHGDPQGRLHWASQFDDGFSCVDYDRKAYVAEDGDFRLIDMADHQAGYCPLDLYLMGLARRDEVKELRLMAPVGADRFTVRETVTLADIERACGTRSRPGENIGRTFRQAFVVLTSDPANGRAIAVAVEAFLPDYEAAFKSATLGRATLIARIT